MTPLATSYSTTPFSLPPQTTTPSLVYHLLRSIFSSRMECCVDRLSSPPERGHRLSAFGMSGLARRIFTLQHWSAQPCVRPVCAVRMTAGHNALRGSGPGQQHAFEDAVALVGCPDRRIDRHCITCCSPSQPLPQHRGLRRDLVYAASAAGSL